MCVVERERESEVARETGLKDSERGEKEGGGLRKSVCVCAGD